MDPRSREVHLVTGGNGYIGLHVVTALLSKGFIVHTTVRSNKFKKVAALYALRDRHQPGRLQIFHADLLRPGSFTKAMKGCTVVHHIASPFLLPEDIKDGETQCIIPAVEGARNVLASVNETYSVKRVVFMSSVGAIYGDSRDVIEYMDGTLTEEYWNETSTSHHYPFHYSKVLAEKEAWMISKEQSRWDMVVICPGLALGPSLSQDGSDSGSVVLMNRIFGGQLFFGAPNLHLPVVDVREVATAHVQAADLPWASGRYILAATETRSLGDIARICRRQKGASRLIPTHKVPDFLLRICAPWIRLSQYWLSRNLGVGFSLDNSRSYKDLGIDYRPLEETIADHFVVWKEAKLARR
ncbi:hypothetical protein MCOR27_000042 [Pyricularia oryzae]|uniref:Secondary metabolism biosynthetic enzyme n=4 Tax=Pyricularia TaxID=48558 RepID=A0ABQ8NXT1_PYRGI|nr:leucoanthocyanidin reductase [Pyricularia oryzae 70-15]ELQ44815.1 leucoanthocyanidin reductase [Pyricularia oryzae Y34]KAH8842832.1 hypothetical protein MCOR01_006728 [Pyricularia oryzae]KAI6302301.1 putative secondary metabolism biosynthetic enzyme [Pyricularia grisea]EHA56457.1 leucoanthocyanidin reductase [Pyricularia oryzae 70-15]KAH9436048.1 hypothetical protein MCOR02_004957 [Pyricularia oryzae]